MTTISASRTNTAHTFGIWRETAAAVASWVEGRQRAAKIEELRRLQPHVLHDIGLSGFKSLPAEEQEVRYAEAVRLSRPGC